MELTIVRPCFLFFFSQFVFSWAYRLAFQCRYFGETVLALVSAGGGIEVLVVPPPNPVAAAGLFRVELRLGNGQCTTKGCAEGMLKCQIISFFSAHQVVSLLLLFLLQRMWHTHHTTAQMTTQSLKSCETQSMLKCAFWIGPIQTSI